MPIHHLGTQIHIALDSDPDPMRLYRISISAGIAWLDAAEVMEQLGVSRREAEEIAQGKAELIAMATPLRLRYFRGLFELVQISWQRA
jgi:hypothetical protein